MADQIAQHGIERPQLLELPEDEAHDVLHLLVGVEGDLPRGLPHIARWHGKSQRPTARFAQAPLLQALPQNVQLGLRHGALETEQQPIVVLRRVVDSVDVGDERAKESAQF